MKKSSFSEEQISFALKQAETGISIKEIVRKMGITEQTFYRWKRKEEKNVSGTNQSWAMDFVSDQLFNGKRFRALTIIDIYSRECLAIHVAQSIKGKNVVDVLSQLKLTRGVPDAIKVDNVPEFISRALDVWGLIMHILNYIFQDPEHRQIML